MEKLQKLKSLIKLHKLFHYEFRIPKELFYKLKLKTYFVSSSDEFVICYGNKKLYNYLKDYDILYVDQYKVIFRKVILNKIIIILTFILICLTFLSSSYFIREIKFKDESMYDYRVYSYVSSKLDKKWFLYTLSDDINSISLSLRATFPNYAYIGISKSGGSLLIDIEKIDIKENNKVVKNKNSLISNYNAVIYGINCKEGVVLVNLNQSIKKGEVLVTPHSESGYCDAVILGSLAEYMTVVVKKEKLIFDYTGKFNRKYNIRFGNKNVLNYKNVYDNQAIELKPIINFFNYIALDKVYYYEKDFIKLVYNYEDAYNYAISSIYYNLEIYRKSDLEKINDIKLLNYEENEDSFTFFFLVNEIKSIGIYS